MNTESGIAHVGTGASAVDQVTPPRLAPSGRDTPSGIPSQGPTLATGIRVPLLLIK